MVRFIYFMITCKIVDSLSSGFVISVSLYKASLTCCITVDMYKYTAFTSINDLTDRWKD